MSTGEKQSLHAAKRTAHEILEALKPACVRIEIAGSIRREVPLVGDIEMVAIPRFSDRQLSLIGVSEDDAIGRDGTFARTRNGKVDHLFNTLSDLVSRKALLPIRGFKQGAKMMQFATRHGIKLDLFICTYDTWGVNFCVRTGSADFSHGLFVHANRMGITSENARLVHKEDRRIIATPEEPDVFRALGLAWVDPRARMSAKDLRKL